MKNKNRRHYNIFYYVMTLLIAASVFLLSKNVLAAQITAENIINLTNNERQINNLPALNVSALLTKAAEQKAQDLFIGQYFAHSSPEGRLFSDWIRSSGYEYVYAGENLAMDFISAEGVVRAWMKSNSHRDNILNNNYTQIAVAISQGLFNGSFTTIVVQIFGQPFSVNSNLVSSAAWQNPFAGNALIVPSLINFHNYDIFSFNQKNYLGISRYLWMPAREITVKHLDSLNYPVVAAAREKNIATNNKQYSLWQLYLIAYPLLLIAIILILHSPLIYRQKPSYNN